VTNPLFKKLNGYQKANRARFRLFTDTKFKLTAEEFVLYEFLIAITDWDETHTETYGTFDSTDRDIAEVLHWESGSTVNRWRNRLIIKNLVRKQNNNRFWVAGFDKWKLRKADSKKEENNVFLQREDAKKHNRVAEIDKNQAQHTDYSLVSSKVQFNNALDENLNDNEISQLILDIENSSLASKSGAVQKEFSSVAIDEQLALAKSIFGEGTKWAEET